MTADKTAHQSIEIKLHLLERPVFAAGCQSSKVIIIHHLGNLQHGSDTCKLIELLTLFVILFLTLLVTWLVTLLGTLLVMLF